MYEISITNILVLQSCKKKLVYIENIQYAINFYGTDLQVNVRRGLLRTQLKIYGGASLQKSQKSVIVDVRLGSKYVFVIAYRVEKVYLI